MTKSSNTISESQPGVVVENIVLAAEVAFAARGFDGTAMKAIAQEAQVSQALLHYHFGTKECLYAEVIRSRSKKINQERHELLDGVDMESSNALYQILNALYRPPLGPVGGAAPYARIFAGLIVGRERDEILVRECYDPTAERFIDKLQQLIPDTDRSDAAMSYTLALGSLMAVVGRNGRVERLMKKSDAATLLDTEEILKDLVKFAAGGISALIKTKASN